MSQAWDGGLVIDSERLFETVVECLPIGVLILTVDGTITTVNAEIERQFGYSRHELYGRSVDVLIPNGLSSAPAKGPDAQPSNRALSGRTKNGAHIPLEIAVKPLLTDAGAFVVATLVPSAADPRAHIATPGPAAVRSVHAERTQRQRTLEHVLESDALVGRSAAIRRVSAMIEHVAPTDATVLLVGESGTGKALLAARIHELSARRGNAMVQVDCGAIPPAQIDSDLFGRERGGSTSTVTPQAGRFELADHSTIFLDEIGDLPLDAQVKVLRLLEYRQVQRVGGAAAIDVDTRVIAATHRNLEQHIADGRFREDFFSRLTVFPIHIPPLRERADDIPALVWHFVDRLSSPEDRRFESIRVDDMSALQRYPWPGNIRELRHAVERALAMATGKELRIPVPTSSAGASPSTRLADVERDHIRRVLDASAWRIRGAGGAADRLGLAPTTLEARMARLGLTRSHRPS